MTSFLLRKSFHFLYILLFVETINFQINLCCQMNNEKIVNLSFQFVISFKMDQIKVKVGEYNFNEAGDTLDSTFNLASMKYHENYNTKTYENDIAILKLERPVTFSRSVYPICLPPRGEVYANRRAFVIGNYHSYILLCND